MAYTTIGMEAHNIGVPTAAGEDAPAVWTFTKCGKIRYLSRTWSEAALEVVDNGIVLGSVTDSAAQRRRSGDDPRSEKYAFPRAEGTLRDGQSSQEPDGRTPEGTTHQLPTRQHDHLAAGNLHTRTATAGYGEDSDQTHHESGYVSGNGTDGRESHPTNRSVCTTPRYAIVVGDADLRVGEESSDGGCPTHLRTRRSAHGDGEAEGDRRGPRGTLGAAGRPQSDGNDGMLNTTATVLQQTRNSRDAVQVPHSRSSPRRRRTTSGADYEQHLERDNDVLKESDLTMRWPAAANDDSHASAAQMNLPLHAKDIPRATLKDRLDRLRIVDALCGTRHAAVFERLCTLFDGPVTQIDLNDQTNAITMMCSELTEDDIEILLQRGLINETKLSGKTQQARIQRVRTFSTPELKKNRRRWITHTPDLNRRLQTRKAEGSDPWPEFTLLDTHTAMKRVALSRFAVCCDFSGFYHQFAAVPKEPFMFHHLGRYFTLTTIPTGSSPCAAVAQEQSEAAASFIRKMFPEVHVDVYIDNVRLAANDEQLLRRALVAFFEVCKSLQIDINENLEDLLQKSFTKYTFLGIQYDHDARTTRLDPEYTQKLLEIYQHFDTQANPRQVTLRNLLRFFGRLTYASAVNGLARAPYYYIMKFMRRQVGRRLDAPTEVWSSIIPLWKTWASAQMTAQPRSWSHLGHANGECESVLITDASLSGYGCILLRADGTTSIVAGKWSAEESKHSINLLEVRALRIGLESFAVDLADDPFSVLIDNTTAMYAVKNGCSRAFEINDEVARVALLTTRMTSINWVKSENNAADPFTRFEDGRDWPSRLRDMQTRLRRSTTKTPEGTSQLPPATGAF